MARRVGWVGGHVRRDQAILKYLSSSFPLLTPAPPPFLLDRLKWTAFLFFLDIPLSTSVLYSARAKAAVINLGDMI